MSAGDGAVDGVALFLMMVKLVMPNGYVVEQRSYPLTHAECKMFVDAQALRVPKGARAQFDCVVLPDRLRPTGRPTVPLDRRRMPGR